VQALFDRLVRGRENNARPQEPPAIDAQGVHEWSFWLMKAGCSS